MIGSIKPCYPCQVIKTPFDWSFPVIYTCIYIYIYSYIYKYIYILYTYILCPYTWTYAASFLVGLGVGLCTYATAQGKNLSALLALSRPESPLAEFVQSKEFVGSAAISTIQYVHIERYVQYVLYSMSSMFVCTVCTHVRMYVIPYT